MLEANVRMMNSAVQRGVGMDVIIVSTGNAQQEAFWQDRLLKMRGILTKPDAILVAVWEDWPGGAGNALGTLYAYKKAKEKILKRSGVDIEAMLRQGASIAIYHTAGQGIRLFPLTASEHGNKSAVKLPGLIGPEGNQEPITILEAVIKQTAIYAPGMKGRMAVFWGDQLFIPTTNCQEAPRSHIAVLGKAAPLPNATQWKVDGLNNYGILTGRDESWAYLEKITFQTFSELTTANIGVSMGSFSLSGVLTRALLEFFADELTEKSAKRDVEPHLWMPSTLDLSTYIKLMLPRGWSEERSRHHHARIQSFKETFCREHPGLPFFAMIDIGERSCWWDLGTLPNYYGNIMKLVNDTAEGSLMRLFFNHEGIPLQCRIGSGNIRNSVLACVTADQIDVADSIIINTSAATIRGSHVLLYNVQESSPLDLSPETVRADTFLQGEHLKMYTELGRDGKADWAITLPPNPCSYEELYKQLC